MKSSRKKTSRGPAARGADWHRLEVPVPEQSRLTVVAGGLPGREPPQSSRLIESIAAASSVTSVPATWLVAPSRRVGNEWIETLSRTGRPTANLHVTTLSALAYDIVSDALAAQKLTLAPRRARLVAVEQLLVEHREQLSSFAGSGGPLQRLAERVLHSLEALRAAGLAPVDVMRGLRPSEKARDLALLMDLYATKLRQMNLIDVAGELTLAAEHVRKGTLPDTLGRLLVPDDLDPPRLERDLLDALRASPRVEVHGLSTDPPVPEDGALPSLARVTLFRGAGESNEVRFVLRTCLRQGLRLDEVEVVHTDAATYPTLIRDIVAALPNDAGEQQGARHADHLPVTFADGLPLADSKPGRAVAAWIEWRRDGHPQSGIERMLRDGLVELHDSSADFPRSAALVRELRGVRIGRGLDRTVSFVAAAAARAKEQPADAFARARHDDDWSEDGEADEIGEELLAARKQRHIAVLEALQRLTQRLADCEGGFDTDAAPDAKAVLRGARLFIETLCVSESEFDGNARRLLLDEIDAMLEWQTAHPVDGGRKGAAGREVLDWLERLPQELVVLGSGPRPGCLHVSSLATGGHSGRPYTFVVGLDENRFPGGGATDPLLTDGERMLLNAAQPDARLAVAHDAAAKNMLSWRRLLGRLRGQIWLGFSCRDTAEDAEVFPSPVLLSLFAQATGNPLAKVDDLVASLPPAETLVPADREAALDETQWWLASLGPLATPSQLGAALAAHRGHLAHGQAAEAARASVQFTPYDGLVPAAGRLLDPRGDHGRVASANSLETLGACPLRFFFRYGLGVEPLQAFDDDADRWLNPLDAGSLLHAVLERFMRGIIERAELPEFERHLATLLAILDEELEESRRKHPPLTDLSFIARRAEMQTAMRTFLHDEERMCRETGLRPLALEAAIGVEPGESGTTFDCRDPVTVALAPGETIRLRGRIDRIDVRDEGAGGVSYALWDYKSGSGFGFPANGADDPFVGGRKLQHGLYVVMLHERLAASGGALAGGRVERFGYFFPSRAGKGRRLTWSSGQLEGCLGLVRQLAEIATHGVFLPTSSTSDCAHCDFAIVCGDASRVTKAAARKLSASEPLQQLFGGLRSTPRPATALDIRRPLTEPWARTPHPAAPDTPPDEPARTRIREDLGTTLLVEAAAGTGKTSSMVDRMLGLVRTGTARPESIVAVTFTKKAAGELRRRFREKLQQAVVATADRSERERLAAALERIDRMFIGTIHSFAGRLLRERPLEAGVDPGFRELDEPADRLLRRQAWREFVGAAPTDYADLLARLDAVGLRLGDFSGVFLDRFATYGDVESWPAPESPAPDMARIVAALEIFVAGVEAADFPSPADRGTDELMTALEQFARMFRRCDTSSSVAVLDLVGELDRAPKVTQKYWAGVGDSEAERKAACKAAAERWQAAWDDARERIAQPALWQWRAHRYPLAMTALQAARSIYDRLRAERGVLSFQDLLCKAAGLLAGSPTVRRSFRSRYTHILVDEFQDTDPVQAQLLLLLTASDPDEGAWRRCRPVPGSLFVVGDPKQSLYRFRRADIVTYATVKEIIESSGAVLALTTNFRSRGDLVEWANGIFQGEFPPVATLESPSFTPSLTGRQEDPSADGSDATHWLTGVRALRFVRSGHAGDAWAEREAREIAACIRGAIDSGCGVPRTKAETAKGVAAACRPGDFLIIGRERRHLGIYAEALHAVGLPVDVTGTLGEDQAEPLRHLRECLAVLADPDDPVASLAILRGGIFGFSDVDLHAYKTHGGRFGGGLDVPAALEPALRQRFQQARDTVYRWRRWLRQLPVVAAIERVIDDAGLMLIAAAANGEAGPRGRAVAGLLQKYIETIRSDRLDIVSVHDCLDLLDDMVDATTRSEFDPLSIDPPTTDRVRVMNLHKAKGLEAPVVFLADYQCREAGEKPEDGPFLHIDRTGDRTEGWLAVTTSFGRSQRIIAAPPAWPERCTRERAFEAAEQIRLDYVAATRPGACVVVSLFEKHDAGTKTRPASHTAEGAWRRFGPALSGAGDLPEMEAGASSRPGVTEEASVQPSPGLGEDLRRRIAAICRPTFARISPREVLTEPAEGIRFTGHGLGEPWGRAIHCLIELASRDPAIDLDAAAAMALSAEEVSPTHRTQAVAIVRSIMGSDVWLRSQASGRRYVEVPFSLQVRGEDLPENVRPLAGDGEASLPTVIRGVIDLVFEEPFPQEALSQQSLPSGHRAPKNAARGRWTVVDWKTDSVTAASEALLEAHYLPQVELYADCWSRVLARLPSGEIP